MPVFDLVNVSSGFEKTSQGCYIVINKDRFIGTPVSEVV